MSQKGRKGKKKSEKGWNFKKVKGLTKKSQLWPKSQRLTKDGSKMLTSKNDELQYKKRLQRLSMVKKARISRKNHPRNQAHRIMSKGQRKGLRKIGETKFLVQFYTEEFWTKIWSTVFEISVWHQGKENELILKKKNDNKTLDLRDDHMCVTHYKP